MCFNGYSPIILCDSSLINNNNNQQHISQARLQVYLQYKQQQQQQYYQQSNYTGLTQLSNELNITNRHLSNFNIINIQSNDQQFNILYNALQNENDKNKFKYIDNEGRKIFKTQDLSNKEWYMIAFIITQFTKDKKRELGLNQNNYLYSLKNVCNGNDSIVSKAQNGYIKHYLRSP